MCRIGTNIFTKEGQYTNAIFFFLHRLDGLVEGGTKNYRTALYLGGNLDTQYAEAEVLRADAAAAAVLLGLCRLGARPARDRD